MSELQITKKLLDLPPDDEMSINLVKRIRKLRWIGMEDEAKRLESILTQVSTTTDSVLAEQYCTD